MRKVFKTARRENWLNYVEDVDVTMCYSEVEKAFELKTGAGEAVYFEVTDERPRGENFQVLQWIKSPGQYEFKEFDARGDDEFKKWRPLMGQVTRFLRQQFPRASVIYVSAYEYEI